MKSKYSAWLFAILLVLLPVAATAQQKVEVGDKQKHKLSMTTRMFISELNDGGFDPVKQAERQRARMAAPGKRGPRLQEPRRRSKNEGRMYAAPDTVNGRAYVSAFITLEDNNDVSALEALGVKVQCKFKDGIITSEIPVDKLAEVAEMGDVKEICVARVMEPSTDISRKRTHVEDILIQSADALRAGIDNKYDGSGVLLGIIDKGIDFNHIAFKDKEGKSRIVKAYIYDAPPEDDKDYDENGWYEHDYDITSIYDATTDDPNEDHGTHTASIAGGSSVIIDGNNVTVTDEHDKATYGGMAPGASLFLCGVRGLKDTYLCNSFYRICNYADRLNLPVVISNSWSTIVGPHDGSGIYASICAQYFGDNNPNHICLFSTGNYAGKRILSEGGGDHVCGSSSKDNPLGTILREKYYDNTDGGYYYSNLIAYACSRLFCTNMECRIYVLNNITGEVLATFPVTGSTTISGISDYYSGDLNVEVTETGLYIYSNNGLETKKRHGNDSFYISDYTLAFEVYPKSGTAYIDIWGDEYNYFTNHLNTEGKTWTAGSDDMSVGDQTTIPEVISVGAYVSREEGTDYKGKTHSVDDLYTDGDIAFFSSYATADQSPTGEFYPWITAPGTCVVGAVNHYHKSGWFLGSKNEEVIEYYRVNNNTTYPYGTLSGTSQACPAVAGIVALWLQAAKEVGMDLTTSDVKSIMAETAIKDSYVTGANASHFGNGKIDALAGLAKILEKGRKPMIQTEPKELTFDGPLNEQQSLTILVKGLYITGTITATLTDESGTFSIDKSSIAASNEGTDITVSWNPTTAGTATATLTLSAEGVADVTVTLTGHSDVAGISASTSRMVLSTRAGEETSQTLTIQGRYLTGNISLSISGDSHAFSVTPTTISQSNSGKPVDVTVTFSPSYEGSYSAVLSLNSSGMETASVILSGTCTDGSTQLARYEYWFDNNIGDKTSVTISGFEKTINTSINTDGLSEGMHTLNLRLKQSGGDFDYSPVIQTKFFKHNTSKGSKVEYWFDDNSHATTSISCSEDEEVTLDLTDNSKFPLGYHQLNMRVSTPGRSPSSIYSTGVMKFSSDSRYLEYWVDGNFSSRRRVEGTVSDNGGIVFNQVKLPLTNVSPGLHHLYYRTCNSQGVAGSAVYSAVIFRHASEASQIEYWVDDDLSTLQRKEFAESFQNGDAYTLDLSSDVFPLGLHQLNIRVSTKNGSRSSVYSMPVVKKTAAKYIEYWVDNDFEEGRRRFEGNWSDDGSLVFNKVQLPMTDVSPGLHHLYYRTTDVNGMPCSAVYSAVIFRHASEASQIEYWVDDDLSTLQCKEFAESYQNGATYTLNLSDAVFPQGLHQLNIRVSTANGSRSSIYSMPVVKMSAGSFSTYEFWLDNDRDNIQTLQGSQSDEGLVFVGNLDLDYADPGIHYLHYRAIGQDGKPSNSVGEWPVLVKSRFTMDPSELTVTGYSVSVDGGAADVRNVASPAYQVEQPYVLDARNLRKGEHTVKLTVWNSLGAMSTDQATFTVSDTEQPTLTLTASEEGGLVRLRFLPVPNDLRYRIIREDGNGVKTKVDSKEGSSYPDAVTFSDNPAAGTYTYHVQSLYTDHSGRHHSIESNRVTVTVAEPQTEIVAATEFGSIVGSIVCDKNTPKSSLRVRFSDGVVASAPLARFSRVRIPAGTVLTLTVEGDDTHEYAEQTVTMKAGVNHITLSGTLLDEYQPNNLVSDLAFSSAVELTVENGKHYAAFSVKNLSYINDWTGDIRVKAINKEKAYGMNTGIADMSYETKNLYIGEAADVSLAHGGQRELKVHIKDLKPKKDTDFYLYFETEGQWTGSSYPKERKPMGINGDCDMAENPVVRTIGKAGEVTQPWDDDARQRFASLIIAASSLIPGVDGNVGDLSAFKSEALKMVKAIIGKTDDSAIQAFFQWMAGKSVWEILNEPGLFSISSTVFDIYFNVKSSLGGTMLQKYWSDVLGASYDYASAQLMISDISMLAHAAMGKDPIEATAAAAGTIYSLVYPTTSAGAVPYAAMLYSYTVVGRALVNKLLEYAAIMRSRYIVTRLKANRPFSGGDGSRQNTAVDFKLVVKTKNWIGSSTINFTKAAASSQILSISIKAAHQAGQEPAEFSFTPVFMDDCVMLRTDGNGITNNKFLDDMNELRELYMEINWANGRQTLIPLNQETSGIDISFKGTDPQGIDHFEDYKPLVYTVSLTTTTGRDNMADEFYLGTNKNRE